MSKVFVNLAVVLILSLMGCSRESPVNTPITETSSGKVLLKIDRENAPSNVTTVTANLTRQGYDTLTGTLNLLSSTSADITFQSVPVGLWHLRVEAKNDSNVVLYAGETDVLVQENFTTQVSLTLVSTGSGVGNIYIIVNWGITSQNWIDYQLNPILTSYVSPTIPNGVMQGKILFEDNLYKMWFTNLYNAGAADVGYVTSINGINWNSPVSEPVLKRGVYPAWDYHSVQVGAILKENGIYKMYYTGMQSQYEMWHIGLATSSDGINWQKRNSPVLFANNVEPKIHVDEVIKYQNQYFMFYSIVGNNYRIGLATSTDGINWTRFSGNPILSYTNTWEGAGVYFPSIIFENNIFKMIYMNSTSTGFGLAISNNLMNWNKESSNPIFRVQNTYNNWTSEIAYPFWRKFGAETRIYYTGYNNGNPLIGMARKLN